MKNLKYYLSLYIMVVLGLGPITCTHAAPIDPTRPANLPMSGQNESSKQPLILTAIYIHPQKRLAVIDGQLVKTGEMISGFTITRINPYTVELLGPGKEPMMLQIVLPIKELK